MPIVTGNGGSSPFLLAKRTFTDDEIKALPTTLPEMVTAQGAGKIVVPLHAMMIGNFANGSYSNINANATLGIGPAGSGGDVFLAIQLQAGLTQVGHFFRSINDFPGSILGPGSISLDSGPANTFSYPGGTDDFAAFADQPLQIITENGVAGDWTGGDPLNSMVVAVTYYVLDLPT